MRRSTGGVSIAMTERKSDKDHISEKSEEASEDDSDYEYEYGGATPIPVKSRSNSGGLERRGRSNSNDNANNEDVLMGDERRLLASSSWTDSEIQLNYEGPKRTASFLSSVINLSNTILGAGMLGLPYALSKFGYGFGSLLLVLSALASAFGLHLLVRCSDHCKNTAASYYVCAKQTYPYFAFIIDFVVLIKCFGVATSYLIVIGDLMPDVISHFLGDAVVGDEVVLSGRLWIGIFGLVVIPLAFLRQLNSLRFTSLMALLTVVYLVGLVVAFFFLEEYKPQGIQAFI